MNIVSTLILRFRFQLVLQKLRSFLTSFGPFVIDFILTVDVTFDVVLAFDVKYKINVDFECFEL